VRRFGGGDSELIAALLHALALLQICLLTLLGLFLLFALLLEGERHRMALLLIDGELEIGEGTSGGHGCGVVLRFYFFSLPISVANFFFNFFKRNATPPKVALSGMRVQEHAGLSMAPIVKNRCVFLFFTFL
jgi:hypothetical protein